MFIRKKKNKSGVVSIQIIDKSSGAYRVVMTIGSSADSEEITHLYQKALNEIPRLTGQQSLNFDIEKEDALVNMFFNGIEDLKLVGPELVLGKLFNEIGFNAIEDELFRHLVITRLVYPVSKLKTLDYLYKYKNVFIEKDKVYRYLDKLSNKYKKQLQQISYNHTLSILNNSISIVFYDVTTLYFEIDDEDDLRRTGFSKEGRHQNPQIVLGLLVSIDGYPLAYEIFDGKKFEGHTMLPVIEAFKKDFSLQHLVIIADAGLLSNDNIMELHNKGYEYILGARLKNESKAVQKQILSLALKNGESAAIQKDECTKIIISYSSARAKKDEANRKRGLQKLEMAVKSGKLNKKSINNRGYNKYLKLEGQINVCIDYSKYKADGRWDGLKGYVTNTKLSNNDIIENYRHLWNIEKAFRISKTDLKVRPVYHRLQSRIEAHLCIAFCAYKIYKELERQLKIKQPGISPEKAIEILKTIYSLTILTPYSKKPLSRLILKKAEQQLILKLFES
ncbi:MAG TPA: IS1634 family transposase [Chitinophagaceae bacterium]|nr:IS1634 family transposase [Chitinophagaceae bacterium]